MGTCGSKENSKKSKKIKYTDIDNELRIMDQGAGHAERRSTMFNPKIYNHVVANKGSVELDYDMEKTPLGQGAFGEVKKATHRASGLKRAIKIIYKDKCHPDDLAKIKDEVTILAGLDHPHILKIYEYFEDENHLYIVTELCTGGELFKKIITKKRFNEKECIHIMEQILSAVVFCHKQNIIHRDLKPENILFATENEDSILKVVDFGTSVKIGQGKLQEEIGTPYYIAPEVLFNNYDAKCDVWSLGVIMYILLTGKPPFNGKDDKTIIQKVKEGRYSMGRTQFKFVSEAGKDLLQRMLLYNPEKRLSAEDCYNHRWFKKDHKLNKKKLDPSTLANFKRFHYKSKLQKALYYFLAHNLASEDEKKALTATFKALDTNGDGMLDKKEIKKGYKKTIGITNAELDNLLKLVDMNGKASINFSEFMVASLDKRQILTDERIEACFKIFDKEGTGIITVKKFKEMLGGDNISDSKWELKLRNEVDSAENGEINLEEFKTIFRQMIQESRAEL